jgi:hypothetical protein
VPDLHRLIGGYLEVAHAWPTGDVLYVDEEGLFKSPHHWFRVEGAHQPFAGNGVVVGREIGNTADTYPPIITVDQLADIVSFAVVR